MEHISKVEGHQTWIVNDRPSCRSRLQSFSSISQSQTMVNQRPHSSSSPKIASQTPEKFAPQVESETLLLAPREEVLETKSSRQPMSRRRRASSRTNRDDRRHQVRRYKTGGSTYRPNYDALPERRRDYREYPERSLELEPVRRESYQEYSTTSETYKKRFNPGYPHDDYPWERRPLYEFKSLR